MVKERPSSRYWSVFRNSFASERLRPQGTSL